MPRTVVILCIVYIHLQRCSSEADCKRSSKFIEKDNEVVDGVMIFLHTEPECTSPPVSGKIVEYSHHWAIYFIFPDTGRIITHEGKIIDEEGVSCSSNSAPPEGAGVTVRFIGSISASPKQSVNFAKDTESNINYHLLYNYSQNWVMSLAKLIGGEIWSKMKDHKSFFKQLKVNKYGIKDTNAVVVYQRKNDKQDADYLYCLATMGLSVVSLYFAPQTLLGYAGVAGSMLVNGMTCSEIINIALEKAGFK